MWKKLYSNVTSLEWHFTVLSKQEKWYTLVIIVSPGKGVNIDLKTFAAPGRMQKEKSNG
jgi:hypothetical protein